MAQRERLLAQIFDLETMAGSIATEVQNAAFVRAVGEGGGQWGHQIAAAVLLECDDGPPARPGVAAQREDRHPRVDPGADDQRFIGVHPQCRRAGLAPAGLRGSAAAALQWEDGIEQRVRKGPGGHPPSVVGGADSGSP